MQGKVTGVSDVMVTDAQHLSGQVNDVLPYSHTVSDLSMHHCTGHNCTPGLLAGVMLHAMCCQGSFNVCQNVEWWWACCQPLYHTWVRWLLLTTAVLGRQLRMTAVQVEGREPGVGVQQSFTQDAPQPLLLAA